MRARDDRHELQQALVQEQEQPRAHHAKLPLQEQRANHGRLQEQVPQVPQVPQVQ